MLYPASTITDVTKAEGKAAPLTSSYVSLSPFPLQTVTVNYANHSNQATVGNDFNQPAASLTFAPGQMTQQIIVRVNGDTDVETIEDFTDLRTQ